MRRTLCLRFFEAVRSSVWRTPTRLGLDWFVPGTEQTLYIRGLHVLGSIVRDFLLFRDLHDWTAVETDLRNLWDQHLIPQSTLPAFLWVAGRMDVIGRSLRGDPTVARLEDRIVADRSPDGSFTVPPISRSARTVSFTLRRPLMLDLRSRLFRWFADPPDRAEKPLFHLVLRKRYLVGADHEEWRLSTVEYQFHRACPHEDHQAILQTKMPAVAPFYDSDTRDQEASGWIATPHVTVVWLEPSDDPPVFATAHYLAFRFHRGTAQGLSLIGGEEDFASFVGHHRPLRRLIETCIQGDPNDEECREAHDRPWP